MLPPQIFAIPGRTVALLYAVMVAGTVLITLFANLLHTSLTWRSR